MQHAGKMWTPLLVFVVLLSLSSHVCWVPVSVGLCPRCLLQPLCWMVIAKLCCTTTSVSWVLYTVFHCAVQVYSQMAQSTPQYQSGLYLLHEDRRSQHLWCVWCKSVLEACSGLQVPWGPWRYSLIRALLGCDVHWEITCYSVIL